MDALVRLVDLPGIHPNLSAGQPDWARPLFDELLQTHPAQADTIRQVVEELERDYPVRS